MGKYLEDELEPSSDRSDYLSELDAPLDAGRWSSDRSLVMAQLKLLMRQMDMVQREIHKIAMSLTRLQARHGMLWAMLGGSASIIAALMIKLFL